MIVEIRNCTKAYIDEKLLRKVAQEFFRKAGVKRPSPLTKGLGLSVALVGPAQAQKLNMKYRKKAYVPNVLSFVYQSAPLMAEIVLCPAQIRKDAKKYGILFTQELVRVFTHGLLHIAGYSHKEIQEKFTPLR